MQTHDTWACVNKPAGLDAVGVLIEHDPPGKKVKMCRVVRADRDVRVLFNRRQVEGRTLKDALRKDDSWVSQIFSKFTGWFNYVLWGWCRYGRHALKIRYFRDSRVRDHGSSRSLINALFAGWKQIILIELQDNGADFENLGLWIVVTSRHIIIQRTAHPLESRDGFFTMSQVYRNKKSVMKGDKRWW